MVIFTKPFEISVLCKPFYNMNESVVYHLEILQSFSHNNISTVVLYLSNVIISSALLINYIYMVIFTKPFEISVLCIPFYNMNESMVYHSVI